MHEMRLTLGYPPSVNTYWRSVAGRVLISRKGREYRIGCLARVLMPPQSFGKARLKVTIGCWMPDNRRRDLDNLPKAILDALQHAKMYVDDSQIDDLRIWRIGLDRQDPRVEIEISEIGS